MNYMTTLLLGLTITFAGCVTTTSRTRPPKPSLTIERRADGGFCVDRINAVLLGEYIQDLESGYDE